jgi:hypothetical protein
MTAQKRYCIHASNIAGLGSISVVFNLLISLSKIEPIVNSNVVLLLPKIPFWEKNIQYFNKNWNIVFVKRNKFKYIRLFQRVLDVLFGHKNLPDAEILIVLGDFPLKFKKHQILLFHNINLISNNNGFGFIFHKYFFKQNIKYISKCIVQTDIVEKSLINQFPQLKHLISVLPMPADKIYESASIRNLNNSKLECFYPASFYTHKNHEIIFEFAKNITDSLKKIHISITIEKNNNYFSNNEFITNLGPLTKDEVFNKYAQVDVLLFPSLKESYGLPLIEAMKMNLYIVCADLPYARWLCGDQAKYFNPYDTSSLKLALEEVIYDKNNSIKPNWENALSKIPTNWDEYATIFLN